MRTFHVMNSALEITSKLISFDSVCPDNSSCQDWIADFLSKLGFKITHLNQCGCNNLWAEHIGTGPLVAFAGHSDVVPPGNLESWRSPPFKPEVRSGKLFGRGAADMKGGVGAFLSAVSQFLSVDEANSKISLGVLIAGDEEGPSKGTPAVLKFLSDSGRKLDYCIVGEPTSSINFGDTIKLGRRGSLQGKLIVEGVQGHVGYPYLAENAVHKSLPVLEKLVHAEWDKGDALFQPATFQITSVSAGVAENVVPGTLSVGFNIRFGATTSADKLKKNAEGLCAKELKGKYSLEWRLSAEPFITQQSNFTKLFSDCVTEVSGVTPEFSTSGGTSDARFIAKTCPQVLEFGPINATIHKIDECIEVEELDKLSKIYLSVLGRLSQ